MKLISIVTILLFASSVLILSQIKNLDNKIDKGDATRLPNDSHPRIFHVAEMNSEQIRSMDKGRTVVILPGGILEQHGPFLPSFTDGFWNEQVTKELAEAIAARPGWNALIFPTIPLGNRSSDDPAIRR